MRGELGEIEFVGKLGVVVGETVSAINTVEEGECNETDMRGDCDVVLVLVAEGYEVDAVGVADVLLELVGETVGVVFCGGSDGVFEFDLQNVLEGVGVAVHPRTRCEILFAQAYDDEV